MHIHLHAKAVKHYANKVGNERKGRITRLSFMGLVDSLESTVRRLKWKAKGTQWGDYYEDVNYSSEGLQHKKQIVSDFLDRINPNTVWDFGANIGLFSRIAADKGIRVISLDIDPAAVEKNYLQCIEKGETRILPLLFDLTNPSPGIGWENKERASLFERGPADTVFVLALIHHLAISNNLPFDKIVNLFRTMCNSLIIEFVPKEDSQIKRLLSTREDIFPDYTQKSFEDEFGKYFSIHSCVKIKDSGRILYLMERK